MSDVPVIWAFGNRGDRCHGLVEDALAGEFGATGLTFTHYMELSAAGRDVQGALVVVSGGVQRDYADQIATALDRLQWALVLVTADEETRFPWRLLNGPGRKIWLQMPCGIKTKGVDRVFPIGYPTGTRQKLRKLAPASPVGARRLPWTFIGQMQHRQRRDCIETLGERRDGGRVCRTAGFQQGYDKEEFLTILLNTKLAPSPSGMYTTDCFRVWESLECGCLPVCDRRHFLQPEGYSYWTDLLGEPPPFPTVDKWRDFNAIADKYAKDKALLERDTQKALVWWAGYKTKFAVDLVNDLRSLRHGAGGDLSTGVVDIAPHETPRLSSADGAVNPVHGPAGYPFSARPEDSPADNLPQ